MYNALLFDAPFDALHFYADYGSTFGQLNTWNDIQDWRTWTGKDCPPEDKVRAQKMKDMLNAYNIYPPFIPEFQFKDSVSARRISGQETADMVDKVFPRVKPS